MAYINGKEVLFSPIVNIGSSEQSYNEGYADGQKSMIDESKIIEKTATGSGWVFLDDVSEIPHDITVKLSSDTIIDFNEVTIEVYNENLTDGFTIDPTSGVNALVYRELPIYVPKGTYTVSFGKIVYLQSKSANISITGNTHLASFLMQKTDDAVGYIRVRDDASSSTEWDYSTTIMLNRGEVALPYVPHTEFIHTSDGTGVVEGVKSISPFLAFRAYYIQDEIVDISVTYRKSYGMQTEYDRFWDTFQDCGKRTHYSYGFGGHGWTEETFKPKYDMQPTEAAAMFYACGKFDLVEVLDNAGITLDFSNSTNINTLFAWSQVTRIGEINTTGANNGSMLNMFTQCSNLKTIGKLILKNDGSQSFGGSFFGTCYALENITIEGTIGQSINFLYSPLTVASMKSIIDALKNYAYTDYANTYTLTFNDDAWARLDAAHPDIVFGWDSYRNYISINYGWNT